MNCGIMEERKERVERGIMPWQKCQQKQLRQRGITIENTGVKTVIKSMLRGVNGELTIEIKHSDMMNDTGSG